MCICMHLLYTDIYLHIEHFNSICIQTIAELKDSDTTEASTKNSQKISIPHYALKLIGRGRGLACGQFPLVTYIFTHYVKASKQ